MIPCDEPDVNMFVIQVRIELCIKEKKVCRAALALTTVISSLSNHCSFSSALGHMSGLRAVFIRFTQRRDSSSPGEPATLAVSFTYKHMDEGWFIVVYGQ